LLRQNATICLMEVCGVPNVRFNFAYPPLAGRNPESVKTDQSN